jgi:hypothetical protein
MRQFKAFVKWWVRWFLILASASLLGAGIAFLVLVVMR